MANQTGQEGDGRQELGVNTEERGRPEAGCQREWKWKGTRKAGRRKGRRLFQSVGK